jgi:hypothetical protein
MVVDGGEGYETSSGRGLRVLLVGPSGVAAGGREMAEAVVAADPGPVDLASVPP